jgi:hypothetical protein
MLTDFLTELTKDLPGKWLERLFGPAFLFWAGGLLLVVGPAGLAARWEQLLTLPTLAQVGWLVAALLLLNASAADHGTSAPAPAAPVGGLLALAAAPARSAADRPRPPPRPASKGALERPDAAARKPARSPPPNGWNWPAWSKPASISRPTWPTCVRPPWGTSCGRVERRVVHRYGLDPVLLWPRLWLLLPQDARQEIAAARESLDRLAEAWGWGLCFLVWAFWQPWAAPIALVWMLLAAWLARSPARTFAVLVQSAFDLYRWRLYEALRFPVPEEKGDAERAAGQSLTRYIQRGVP